MLHYAAIGLNGKVIRRLVEQTSAELLDAPDVSIVSTICDSISDQSDFE